jgi:enoyl-CoA hydratase/carnithine racemase
VVAVCETARQSTNQTFGRCALQIPFFGVEVDDGVAICTLDKPPANTLDEDLYDALDALVAAMELDDAVRAIVLASAHESIFVAGADVKRMAEYDFRPGATARKVDLVHAAFGRVERCAKPTVACIAGHALGGGCELALCCDLRVMVDGEARIGLPEVTLGLVPGGGGTQRLPALVGRGRATELMLLGSRLSGPEAVAIGLVNRACPTREATLETARDLARDLAALPGSTLRLIKRCLRVGAYGGVERGLAVEREAVVEALAQPAAREGIAAFLERRAPSFRQEPI